MEFIKKDPKIFVISGKARSGKNEIAKIIQQYYNNKKCITISFGHYIKDYVKRISNWDGNEETKPRELLQQIGIELIKNKINDKLFINRILEDIEIFSYFYDIIIISDARLVEEMEFIKQNHPNSISIRVTRSNYDNKLTKDQKKHVTEIGLDKYINFDYVINNDNNFKQNIIKILSEV